MTLPPTDHFNGKTFFNPGEPMNHGLLPVLRWKMSSRPTPWPRSVPVEVRPVPPAPAGEGVTATWVGHSTFVLRSRSATMLTDPVFSERAGPFSWAGPRRATAPGVALESLPRIDGILLSHDHFDHCDLRSLRWLAHRDQPWIVAPLGHRGLLAGAGFKRIFELDWWERYRLGPDVEALMVPARHWTRRSAWGTNTRLWGGFILTTGGRRVYFAGDSGYQATLFREIGRRCGPVDLALIPIGAYKPRWFMAGAHMDPREAVLVHADVGSRRSVAMHWGTFQLTDEGREEPVTELAEAVRAAGLPEGAFTAPGPGESVSV